MRPTGSKSKLFYKPNGMGNNFPQFASNGTKKRSCIFCKKYGDHDSGFCKKKSFGQKYK